MYDLNFYLASKAFDQKMKGLVTLWIIVPRFVSAEHWKVS